MQTVRTGEKERQFLPPEETMRIPLPNEVEKPVYKDNYSTDKGYPERGFPGFPDGYPDKGFPGFFDKGFSIFDFFKKNIGIEEIILIGLIILLLKERMDDQLLLIMLVYILLF